MFKNNKVSQILLQIMSIVICKVLIIHKEIVRQVYNRIIMICKSFFCRRVLQIWQIAMVKIHLEAAVIHHHIRLIN